MNTRPAEDTAALVETIQAALGPGGVWTSESHAALAALNALAQRLADAERECEIGRRRNATMEDAIANERHAVTALRQQRDAAEARATRAEEALRSARNHIRFHSWRDDPNQNKRRAALDEVEAALALTPTEEPLGYIDHDGTKVPIRDRPTEEPRCPTCNETWRYRMGMAYRTDLCTDDFHLRPTEEPEQ